MGQVASPPTLVAIDPLLLYVDEAYVAETRLNGLPSCEDSIILRSFVVT